LLLRNFEDALALRARFTPDKHIVIIGGGFIGLELASSAIKHDCKVTVIEAQPRILMRGVPEEIARLVSTRHIAAGVNMMVDTKIEALTAEAVYLADGRKIESDTIVAGIGAAPEVALAQDAGLALDNGIAVDHHLRTSDPDIFAAGDCCSFPHPHYGGIRMRLEAWRNAQDQGNIAAENMLERGKIYSAIPWFWSDQYDLSLQIAGFASAGPITVARTPAPGSVLLFHLADNGQLVGASGIGVGNAIARDIKLAEMLIAKQARPTHAQLQDPAVQLKTLLKG
jgi:3-phenylpropionate/trans-cinnamate dioxygenase ferredoxin reductase component